MRVPDRPLIRRRAAGGSVPGVAVTVVSVFLFATNGPVSTLAFEAGAEPIAFTFWRALVAALLAAVGVGILRARGRLLFGGVLPDRSAWTWLAIAGVAMAVQGTALFAAFSAASVLVVLACFYSYPLMVAMVSAAMGWERVDGRRLALLVVASLGCVLVILGGGSSAGAGELPLVGGLLALVAAGGQTVFALAASRGFPRIPAEESATLLFGTQALLVGALAVVLGGAGALAEPLSLPGVPAAMLVSGTLGAAAPIFLYLVGLRLIGPVNAATIALLEPFLGASIAWLLASQPISPLGLMGGLLVVGSAAGVVKRR